MHSVLFDNAQSDWNEALPLGNGVFGGMAYYKDNEFTMVFNHYEVYYSIHSRYSKTYEEKLKNGESLFVSPEYNYQDCLRAAEQNARDYSKESYLHYRKTIWPTADIVKDVELHRGTSHSPTGEIKVMLADEFQNAEDYSLRLNIEEAKTLLCARSKDNIVTVENRVLSDADASFIKIVQSQQGIVKSLKLTYPQRRNHEGSTYQFICENDDTFYYTVSFFPQEEDRSIYEPFHFVVATKLIGAKGKGIICNNELLIEITDDAKEYRVITYVLTELQSHNLVTDALKKVDEIAKTLNVHEQTHKEFWDSYFKKSNIQIPDKFLERLWYLNLYALGCASGKGGKRYEQASGLNGLWDIRQPTIWGSLWYWDVNIQASYWPVYTANHMELAEAFNDGFLSYADMAEKYATEFYGMSGCAIDYPHTFYNCMWPWCAQYLWWYYEYTLDEVFLREKAYPMFKKQIAFIKEIVHYDAQRNEYYFFPDVSPEQGPITRNSTITVATVKYMLKMAIKANQILDNIQEDAELFHELLQKMPVYPVEKIDRYGEVIKDSELAPPDIHLRHPSLLMPIYPISEINMHSEETQRKLGENTLFFASENVEIGVFPFGWVSCAAARLGMGNTALRVLYEQGIDLIFRANGMGAEETDRWINHCAVESGQLYYPAMMECVGEVVACVNELLLQSYDGIITVFPALPNGDVEAYRTVSCQEPLVDCGERIIPVNWTDCSFDKMLAKGAFEVSAEMKNEKVTFIKIKSLQGRTVKIRVPAGMEKYNICSIDGASVDFTMENGIISIHTQKGMEYILSESSAPLSNYITCSLYSKETYEAPIDYVGHLGRRVFAGKDKNTDTMKQIDSFLFDYYVANDRYQTASPYKFSFGVGKEKQTTSLINQCYEPQKGMEHLFIKITPEIRNTTALGFGFGHTDEIKAVDGGETNVLLQDYICGESPASFSIELPKGRYDLLLVSGGADNTYTIAKVNSGVAVELTPKHGEYCSEIIPVIHKKDGEVILMFETKAQRQWNINLLVVKKLGAFM